MRAAFRGVFSGALSGALSGVLALGLALTLWSAVADAAPVHHRRAQHHLINRPGDEVISRPSEDSEEAVPPGWYKFPGYKPIPPEENRNLDPSNRGGG